MTETDQFGLPPTADEYAELKRQLAEANAKLAALPPDTGAAPNEGKGPIDSQGFPKKYVKLTIAESSNPEDLMYVPLAIEGYAIKVTRGKMVILPTVFEEILAHAIQEVTVRSEGGLSTRPALRFPYNVHGPATEEEFLTFRAKMREENKTVTMQ